MDAGYVFSELETQRNDGHISSAPKVRLLWDLLARFEGQPASQSVLVGEMREFMVLLFEYLMISPKLPNSEEQLEDLLSIGRRRGWY